MSKTLEDYLPKLYKPDANALREPIKALFLELIGENGEIRDMFDSYLITYKEKLRKKVEAL